MVSRSQRLAVIPARGGSRRIPLKNIRALCGRPMLAYTIEAAIESGLFSRVVVSTDSDEIATAARAFGAEAPFVRDAKLADDYTISSLVTLDALERLDPDHTVYQHIAQLLPNSPLRTAQDIRDSYQQFTSTNAGSQISVTRYAWLNPWWALTRDESFEIDSIFKEYQQARSQALPEVFCPTGAIWWAKADVLRRARTFYSPNVKAWEISFRHAADVDTEEDWQLVELLMQARPQGSDEES